VQVLLPNLADDPSNPPSFNFLIGEPAAYFNIQTTANFTGPATVCLSYPFGSIGVDGSSPQLFHYESKWVDITLTKSAGNGTQIVCGTVNSFSPFAAGIAQRPLVLKRLKLSTPSNSRKGGDKDSWSLQARLDLSVAASTFLADVDEQVSPLSFAERPQARSTPSPLLVQTATGAASVAPPSNAS